MMPADEIPLDIRRRLRWLPHLPYHTALGRRGLAAITLIGSFFQFKGNARVKAWWVHHGNKGCKVYQPVDKRTDAIMLWIHGGGYIGLAASLDDQFCRRVVEELGITDMPTFPIYLFYKKHNFINLLNDSKSSWGDKELALDWLDQYCEEGDDLRDDTPYGFDEWCDNLEYRVKDYKIIIYQESGTTPYYRSLSTR